jgi:hypothetical protein
MEARPPLMNGHVGIVEKQLGKLSEMLGRRGLDARLVPYPVERARGIFTDALVVSNPADADRGVAYVEVDGCMTWAFTGSLDDAGLSRIAGELTSALRAHGVPFPREVSE